MFKVIIIFATVLSLLVTLMINTSEKIIVEVVPTEASRRPEGSPTTPEPHDFYHPKDKDITAPLNVTDLIPKILPKNGCTPSTTMLIAVRTAHNEFEHRNWVRENWGKLHSNNTAVLFVLGNSKNVNLTEKVAKEQEKYQDLLLLNFDDSYRNLSVKNYGFFKYFVEKCPKASCLVKPDIDTVAYIPGFERVCEQADPNVKLIMSECHPKSYVWRTPGTKWYVPTYIFNRTTYYTFPIGWGYMITGKNTVRDMLDAFQTKSRFMTSENYRMIPDDGMMGEIGWLANVTMQDSRGFGYNSVSLWYDSKANESIPLLSTGNKAALWKDFLEVIRMNKLKRLMNDKNATAIPPMIRLFKNESSPELQLSHVYLSWACQLYNMTKPEDRAKFNVIKDLCV